MKSVATRAIIDHKFLTPPEELVDLENTGSDRSPNKSDSLQTLRKTTQRGRRNTRKVTKVFTPPDADMRFKVDDVDFKEKVP